jgi:hypothetical protein
MVYQSGEDAYGYASCDYGNSSTGKPDIVLENGRSKYRLRDENHAWLFVNCSAIKDCKNL